MDHATDPLRAAIDAHGFAAIARACGVSPYAVRKWLTHGMPRSEWSKETAYAKAIGDLMRDRGFAKRLLAYHAELRAAKVAA